MDGKNNFHLIGIGGIGMSGLAQMLLSKNYPVSGSDLQENSMTQKLVKHGAKVYSSQHRDNIQDNEKTVVFSSAISSDNQELQQAKKLGCRLWHRSDLLAFLMKSYQAIAVAGTHGKTTTSALLSHCLLWTKKSPSFVIGGILSSEKTNSQLGQGKYFVAEADESDGSFLKYSPNYAIVTNIESDHLNHFGCLDEIIEVFKTFIDQVQTLCIWNQDCPILREIQPKGLSYGFHPESDICITQWHQQGEIISFDIKIDGKIYQNIEVSMMGKHSVLNACAVFAQCLTLGLDESSIKNALKNFKGVRRRTEKIGECQEIKIYDDYAHHPTELKCTLRSFRKCFPKRKVIALFQPHRYSRVNHFYDDFAQSFTDADEVWLTDVFSAREVQTQGYQPQKFAQNIENTSRVKTIYVPKNELLTHFIKHIKPFDILVTLGAGDITQFAASSFEKLKSLKPKLNVALITGFESHEHYVSLVSTKFVVQNFDQDLINLRIYKVDTLGQWAICNQELQTIEELTLNEVICHLKSCDIAYPLAHGKGGEDGMIQGFLSTLKIPVCGANYSLCSLNMNKIWMKQFVKGLGIPVVNGCSFSKQEWQDNSKEILTEKIAALNYPLVAKPAQLGSTIGVFYIQDESQLKEAIDQIFKLDSFVVVEERIFGLEFEISCFETEKGLVVTDPGEVKSAQRSYDYEAKYSKNPIEKEVIAEIPEPLIDQLKEMARAIYNEMQLDSYARIDFFYTPDQKIYFAETNTAPGMTPRSLFQRMLIARGIAGREIINQKIILGLNRHRNNFQKNLDLLDFLELIKNVTHNN